MKRSSRLVLVAIAALVLSPHLAGCIPIGIKGQSLPWAASAPAAIAAPGTTAIVNARASM